MYLKPYELPNIKGPFVVLCIEGFRHVKQVYKCSSVDEFYNFTYREYLRIKREQRNLVDKCRIHKKELKKAIQNYTNESGLTKEVLSNNLKVESLKFKLHNHCVMHLSTDYFKPLGSDSIRSFIDLYADITTDNAVAAFVIYEHFATVKPSWCHELDKYHVDTSNQFCHMTYILLPCNK